MELEYEYECEWGYRFEYEYEGERWGDNHQTGEPRLAGEEVAT